MLLGDAATLAEPMTGEGIYYAAIKSAKIGVEAVCETVRSAIFNLSLYTRRTNRQVTRDFRYARRLARLLYRFPRLGFHSFAESPTIRYGIAEVLCGGSTFEQLFYQLVKDSPRILLAAIR